MAPLAKVGVLPLALSSIVLIARFSHAFQRSSPSLRPPGITGANPPKIADPSRRRTQVMAMANGKDKGGDNIPTDEEIVQQKQEAYNALASFHETSHSFTQSSNRQLQSLMAGIDDQLGDLQSPGIDQAKYWECKDGAITYAVPMDPAAGLKRGTVSKPYRCSVQIEMNGNFGGGRGGGGGLRLVESIQFSAEDIPFVRSMPLGANVDVDAVDGTYSLDDVVDASSDMSIGLPLLPPAMVAGGSVDPRAVQFVVEHTLAISETERCRLFLMYGDVSGRSNAVEEEEEEDDDANDGEEDFAVLAAKKAKKGNSKRNMLDDNEAERNYRLLGVVVAEETKIMPEKETSDGESDDDDDSDYAAEFISQMIETQPQDKPASPLDLLEIDQTDRSEEDDKLNRLMQSIDKHNQRVVGDAIGKNYPSGSTKMERHSIGMFGITSGVFLGDTFVRESIPERLLSGIQQQKKGFGKTPSNGSKDERDRFATWQMGVQKIALRFEWDYYECISQSYTYGKVMGTPTSLASIANINSDGIVVVNESRRTKKRTERRVVWDMEGGSYIGGLIDDCSGYFRAPRYMAFSQSRSYNAEPYLTEFMVFYRPGKRDGDSKIIDADIVGNDVAPEYYCSRSARLYNANDGSLTQGSTAFFSMKQPLADSAQQQ